MLDKDTIEKLRKNAGSQALGLLTVLELLDEAITATDEIRNNLKRTLDMLEITDSNIKTAKSRVNAYVSFTVSDEI